ncbi:MAG: hypothetical protein K9N46_13390 [Candidatus Marinimicrobia bacterium]|nr:hypothetical protein [Candidatus Neomarinimicrobiota bacterium]MCF7829775.1 hypothetical protein [Candidatus Neomarinimicrobiota bacterium]MCF7881725.1 hypothetical protein [Candidatus Neomarinimicrobiota bacterium]
MRTQILIGILSLLLPVLTLQPAPPDSEREQGHGSLYDVAFAITGMT